MKIIVLNGSPKGRQSVTMQYVHFIQNMFPRHELKILHIAQRLKKLEKDEQAFQQVIDEIAGADGVLWAFPLYFMLVHGNYKRFIELIWARSVQNVFLGKYTAVLSTSIKFYDDSAINYIHGVCDDLDMNYIGDYSAVMNDLMQKKEQERLTLFARNMFETIEQRKPLFKQYQPILPSHFAYQPGAGPRDIAVGDKKIVVVADIDDPRSNLAQMVERFTRSFAGEVNLFSLKSLDIQGGCLGCLQCGENNVCVWDKKDTFQQWFRANVMTADIIVYAGTMRDRYFSARWKTFVDRQFFHGHAPRLMGKHLGFFVSGPLSQNTNFRQILEVTAEMEHANFLGIVTDECSDSATLDSMIGRFAEYARWCADTGYVKPTTFRSVGGRKLFRDELWGHLRLPFPADHRFYKHHGFYRDFPQKQYKIRLVNALVSPLLAIPAVRRRFFKKEMVPGMIRGLQKVVSQTGR